MTMLLLTLGCTAAVEPLHDPRAGSYFGSSEITIIDPVLPGGQLTRQELQRVRVAELASGFEIELRCHWYTDGSAIDPGFCVWRRDQTTDIRFDAEDGTTEWREEERLRLIVLLRGTITITMMPDGSLYSAPSRWMFDGRKEEP